MMPLIVIQRRLVTKVRKAQICLSMANPLLDADFPTDTNGENGLKLLKK